MVYVHARVSICVGNGGGSGAFPPIEAIVSSLTQVGGWGWVCDKRHKYKNIIFNDVVFLVSKKNYLRGTRKSCISLVFRFDFENC